MQQQVQSATRRMTIKMAEALPLRSLTVRSSGGEGQPSISLLSVSVATKAADVETVGGFSFAASLLDFTEFDWLVGLAPNRN